MLRGWPAVPGSLKKWTHGPGGVFDMLGITHAEVLLKRWR